ncbi:MAG: D-glycerate dehydrogenase [Proteobacteria bacterium]|nr:D-glycerate dehydrogenase [Pseudomonadota bacterium]
MSQKPRIVITRRMTHAVMERARREFDAFIPDDDRMDGEAVLAKLEELNAEGLFFTSGTKLDAKTIARLPNSMRIAATCSVGYDHIDLAAAKARGLVVTNTPDVLTNATADLAFMLILCASRRAFEYERTMRQGWGRYYGMSEMLGIDVSNKTLGIIGMGRIGKAVARRARGFDMKVLYHNRKQATEAGEATYVANLHDMLKQADVVSLNLPAAPGGAPILDRAALVAMKPGAVVVNTARGSLIDEAALYEGLTNGRLYAAGLDVMAGEPNFDKRFAALNNVFLTPHMGSATVEARTAMGGKCLDNLAAVLSGGAPIDPV